jgi:hypothetical protein
MCIADNPEKLTDELSDAPQSIDVCSFTVQWSTLFWDVFGIAMEIMAVSTLLSSSKSSMWVCSATSGLLFFLAISAKLLVFELVAIFLTISVEGFLRWMGFALTLTSIRSLPVFLSQCPDQCLTTNPDGDLFCNPSFFHSGIISDSSVSTL